MTCHLRSYSLLKILLQGKVSAHTPHLQKKGTSFKSYIKRKKKQACRKYCTVYTYKVYTWDLNKVTMQEAPEPIFTDFS